MTSTATWHKILGTLRWIVLLLAIAAGLFLLNDAFFSVWVSGGPLGEHKIGWQRRALASLALSLSCLFAGAFFFRALLRLPSPGRVAWLLAVIAIVLFATPFVAREALIDKCLDGGGSWNYAFLECEH